MRHPLVVTDAFLITRGLPQQLQQQILAAGLVSPAPSSPTPFPDPTTSVVNAGLAAFRAAHCDSLISLGGGSPIDTAKAIAMLSANPGVCRDYKVPAVIPNPGPPHLVIPTTAGTGSEVTRVAVITDADSDEKMLLSAPSLLPTAAIVDLRAHPHHACTSHRRHRYRLPHPRHRSLRQPPRQPLH